MDRNSRSHIKGCPNALNCAIHVPHGIYKGRTSLKQSIKSLHSKAKPCHISRLAGIDILHLCYHPRLLFAGDCRMCDGGSKSKKINKRNSMQYRSNQRIKRPNKLRGSQSMVSKREGHQIFVLKKAAVGMKTSHRHA